MPSLTITFSDEEWGNFTTAASGYRTVPLGDGAYDAAALAAVNNSHEDIAKNVLNDWAYNNLDKDGEPVSGY